MAFRVLYHEDALADLEEIFNWSREQHPETTEQFAKNLFNHIDLLQAFPYVGASVQGNASVRQFLHSPLYVYYRVDADREGIEILHFRHATRTPPRL
jgi:plasmid stabilization system protein ParE